MRRPKREEISNALGSVLFDANNHPNPTAVLGRDFSKLRNEATKAIEQLLDYAEGAEETITIAQARELARMAKEQGWDESVAAFVKSGWLLPSDGLRKSAEKSMYRSNPYRDIIQPDEAVTALLSGAGEDPTCRVVKCGEPKYASGFCEHHYIKRSKVVYRSEQGKSDA